MRSNAFRSTGFRPAPSFFRTGYKPVLLAAALALLPMLAARAQAAEPAKRENYNDRYSVLSEHNIFLRERARPTITHRGPSSQPARPLEESFILTGVVLEDDGLRAYVEDQGRVTKLRIGDPVAHGKIAAIDIDAVAYDQAGQRAWITVGSDFTGRAVTPGALLTEGASTNPTSEPSVDINDPNLTLEQKLKLRRIKELKH